MISELPNILKRCHVPAQNSKILLCVSGGADSVAMVYALDEIAKDIGLKIFICHLNHSLRGRESDKDQRYVESIAKRLRVPIVIGRCDTTAFSKKHKLSIENAARRLRYEFFIKTAVRLRIRTIATAHTRDDQAETVLMRLIRGTGFRGLRGIPVKNVRNNINIIRPLLNVSRNQINAYLMSKKCKPRFDKTNLDTRFSRNKIRLRLLPVLEKFYNPEIKQVLANFAELADKDYEYLDICHRSIFDKLADIDSEGIIRFSLSEINKQHLSVKRGVIRNAIKTLSDTLDNIDYRHWQEIESLIDTRPAGSRVDLPHDLVADKTKTCLRLFLSKARVSENTPAPVAIMKIPCTKYFGRYSVKASMVKARPDFKDKPRFTEYLDIKDTALPLTIRTYSEGDRIRPLGMKNYKKISDIFTDEKIPVEERKNIPLVASCNGDILCVFGIRLSDTCRVSGKTKTIVKLELLTR
jgi:tRNA(Ile)-lysidine synthase